MSCWPVSAAAIAQHRFRHRFGQPTPIARAYNQLSLIASPEAFDKATRLRKRVEDMRAWVVEGDPSKLEDDAVQKCESEIWDLRNQFVEDVREELGQEGQLNWNAGPGS